MQWRAFRYGTGTFDLSHLNPITVVFQQPPAKEKPPHSYTVDVKFSLHCFTRSIVPGATFDPELRYSDDRECRLFDFARYELSRLLPDIVRTLDRRKVYHTGKGNFFTIEIVNRETGVTQDYEIYFLANRSSRKGVLNLFVQSAYVRDAKHLANRPKRKPIHFLVLLFNVANNRPIAIPK